MLDCFENVIGFTRSDCVCFDIDQDYKKSTSGLYLDELDETRHILKAVRSINDCDKRMQDHFSNARENAINSLEEELFREVGTRYKVRNPPFVGTVGIDGFTAALNSNFRYVGSVFQTRPLKGALMRLKRLAVAVNTSTPVDVMIYKAYLVDQQLQIQGPAIATITINAIANNFVYTDLPTPLDLPMYDSSMNQIYYLFLYDRSGLQAMNNKAGCNCDKQKYVEKWILQGGIETDNLTSIQFSQFKHGSAAYGNGLVVDVELMCQDTGFICENYMNTPLIKPINYAILFKAGANLLQSILRAGDVNRHQLTNRDQMTADRNTLNSKFQKRVAWLSENLDLKSNNCYVCNDNNQIGQPYKTGIRF